MRHVRGGNTIEYGGEHPWTHVWMGNLRNVDEINAFELEDNASTEERIKYEVDRFMTFFVDGGATPHDTTVDDFEWSVYVHETPDENPVVRGRLLQVVWEP